MYRCSQCGRPVGALTTEYICPRTRQAAPPVQAVMHRTTAHRIDPQEYAADRGQIATKRRKRTVRVWKVESNTVEVRTIGIDAAKPL